MNDRIKESLSALVDGETDELEVRRILNQLEQDPELRESWQRYQMIGSLMRDEPMASVDLSKGIMQAIDGEPMDEVPAYHNSEGNTGVNSSSNKDAANEKVVKGGFNWLASGAVAASVTIAVLLGVRLNNDLTQQDLVAEAEKPVNPVEQMVASEQLEPEQLEAAQRKLQEYVLQHTENAALNTGRGMMPFARVASFEEPAKESQEADDVDTQTAAPVIETEAKAER